MNKQRLINWIVFNGLAVIFLVIGYFIGGFTINQGIGIVCICMAYSLSTEKLS